MARDDDDDDDRDEDEEEEERPRKRKGPSKDDQQMAMFCHIGGILGGFLLPLIIWMMKKDESKFVDRHGKQALNFTFTMMIAHLVGGFCTCGLLNLVLLPIGIVFHVQAAMAASRGDYYQYPMSITFIS